jgi:hypothetical protein
MSGRSLTAEVTVTHLAFPAAGHSDVEHHV